jgi:double-strand break repair protein MRE11
MDILSVSNLVNYFGKTENMDEITIYPLLFKKGLARLVAFGFIATDPTLFCACSKRF